MIRKKLSLFLMLSTDEKFIGNLLNYYLGVSPYHLNHRNSGQESRLQRSGKQSVPLLFFGVLVLRTCIYFSLEGIKG